MPPRPRKTTLKPSAEMNLTSMMDLTFLLLITFIITFPLIEQGLPIALPKANANHIDSKEHALSITIKADESIYYEQDPISLEDLPTLLQSRMASDPDTFVFVRGDENVRYGRIVSVLQSIHKQGITRMTLVTQEN